MVSSSHAHALCAGGRLELFGVFICKSMRIFTTFRYLYHHVPMKILSRLLMIFITLSAAEGFSQARHVEMRLALAPEIIPVDGNPTTYLEYYVTNTSSDTLELKKFELIETATSKVIATFDQSSLSLRLHDFASGKKVNGALMPGMKAILYLEPVIATRKPQAHLATLLTYDVRKQNTKESHTFQGALNVEKKTTLVLGAPLREGNWAAVYDPGWERGHRRVLYNGDAGPHLPGRYAIDFIKVDDQGLYAAQNEDDIKNWFGYGADVLAVSDGTVGSVRDNFPESATLSAHHQPTSHDATGNYISLMIGKEQVVFYEHLKPGSIRVRPGQQVKKGDVIASLGFTGQSTGPHLHFHVADRDSPLQAEGIPFVFESFTVLGAVADMAKFGKEIWTPVKNSGHRLTHERPAPNHVIRFK